MEDCLKVNEYILNNKYPNPILTIVLEWVLSTQVSNDYSRRHRYSLLQDC